MNIALTVWNGRIAPLFDVAGTLLIAGIEDGRVSERKELSFPPTAGTMRRVSFLEACGAEALICGAVSQQVHRMLSISGIQVYSFVSGDIEEVLEAFLQGSLENDSFRMPGCGMGRGRGAGRGAGSGRCGRNRGSCQPGKRGE